MMKKASLFGEMEIDMDLGSTSHRGISVEQVQTLKIQESWLPVTPAKPIPARPTPLWFDTAGIKLPAQFVQPTTSATAADDQSTGNTLWNSLPYAHLSALANATAGGAPAATTEQTNSNGDRPSFPFSLSHNADKMLHSNSASMVMEYMYSNGLNQTTQPRSTDGFPVTYTPALSTTLYHPNSPPGTVAIADAVPAGSQSLQTTSNMHRETSTYRHCPLEIASGAQDNHLCLGGMANENSSSRFAPSTPQKQHQQYQFVNDMGGETANQNKNGVGCIEKSSQAGSSGAGVSTPLKRNQERDKLYSPIKENHLRQTEKEEEDRIDLNRTPRLKPRRKKHRPRVVTENKPRAPKSACMKNMKDPKTVKRKYVRRGTGNSSTPSADVAGQAKEANRCIVTRSCKRSLNFDQESQTRECHVKIPIQEEKETFQIDNTLNVTHHFGCTSTQMVGEHVPLPESATLPTRRELLRKNLVILGKNDYGHKAKEDCQSIGWKHSQPIDGRLWSSKSQPIDARLWSSKSQPIDGRLWSSKQLDTHAPSNFERVREDMKQDFKRTRSGEGKLFPHIPKKRRTMSTTRNSYGATVADSQRKVIQYCRKKLTTSQWNKATPDKMLCSELVMSIRQTEIRTRKRTKGRARVRNFATLTSIARCNNHMPLKAPTSNNNKIVEMVQILSAKARNSRKRSNENSFCSAKETREQNLVLYSRRHYSAKPRGNLKDVQFKSPIEDLIERLNRLSISGVSSLNEQTALVPFKGDDRLVIYGSKLDLVKKMRPRAKVDLDSETDRMWNVVMGLGASEPAEGTDAEKEKWWEEERQVFRGRVDSFISRMHLIQGDRRFSKWNGSVLDSVIGVFLTQNVSDHLSSSAFITLASKFPLERTRNDNMGRVEEPRMYVEEPEVEVIHPDNVSWHENMTSEPVISQDSQGSVILNETDCIEEKEMGRITEVESNGVSPQNSVKSSLFQVMENSVNSSLFQVTEFSSKYPANSSINKEGEIVRSCSDSNSEEDPSMRCIPNDSSSCTSFMELLQTSIFQECYNSANECLSIDLNSSIPSETGSDEWSYLDTINAQSSVLPYSIIGTPSTIGIPHTPSMNLMSNSCFPATLNTEIIEVQCPKIGPSQGAGEITELSTPLVTRATTVDLPCSSLNKQSVHPNTSLEQEFGLERQLNSWGKSVLEIDQTCLVEGNQSSKPENDALSQKGDSKKQRIGSNSSKVPGETVEVVETPMLLDKSYSRRTGDVESVTKERVNSSGLSNEKTVTASKPNGKKPKEKQKVIDWDYLRKEAYKKYGKRERNSDTMDSLDWEAVRLADVNVIADCIKARGMNNMLAARIKNFLNRLAREHESVDLEWLRDAPPDKVKDYLLSVKGLGLKSVECIRLLTLHHLAFPVDTNVGRIVVRLGWVPLQPLPDSLQLHLLEMYPVQATIQKYLWPRLCKLDQRTLYELHYQLITFGKVFCTKSKPNCNACPMRAECKHFASAFASARLLPAPEEKGIVSSIIPPIPHKSETVTINPTLALPPLKKGNVNSAVPNHGTEVSTNTMLPPLEVNMQSETGTVITNSEPIIEEPESPEPGCNEIVASDIEDAFWDDPDEIPPVGLSVETFQLNIQNFMKENNFELRDVDMSKCLVALTPEAASIPTPKLKNVGRLRTEHQVYELPDSHPLLEGVEKRVPTEVCSYLFAIWTPGETAESTQPPQRCCDSQMSGNDLCTEKTCFSCNSIREANSQTVRGTILIPCKTAMRGSFPLNGTYFQVNEVFADHDSSLNPINVPRAWLWNLPRRTVYFGTSVTTIFRGQSMEQIQSCFWRGYVCVRGFDRKTRAPRPLMARLHFPASRMAAARGKTK